LSKDFQDYLKDLEKVQCGLLEPSTALETILSSTMSMTYLQNKPVITNYITKEVASILTELMSNTPPKQFKAKGPPSQQILAKRPHAQSNLSSSNIKN